MPALDLGYLLGAGSRMVAGARQGAREREELERQREIDDSTRMFNEWAKRNQMQMEADRNREYAAHNKASLASIDQARRDQQQNRLEDNQRQNDTDFRSALTEGFEAAVPEQISTAANAALSGMGMGRFGNVRAQGAAPKSSRAGGVEFKPEETGGMQYATVGGRMVRRDSQRIANRDAQDKAEKLAAQLAAQREPEQWVIDTNADGDRVRVNLRTGQVAPLGYDAKVTGSGTESMRVAKASIPSMENAYQQVINLAGEDGSKFEVGVVDNMAGSIGRAPFVGKAMGPLANPLKSDDYKTYEQAMKAFESSYLFSKGGKALTPAEERVASGKLRIEPNDPPFIRQMKLQELRFALEETKTMSGQQSQGKKYREDPY